MQVNRLDPKPTDRSQFDWGCVRDIPNRPGCYVLAGHAVEKSTHQPAHVVLYIGQTKNLSRRFEEHLADEDKHEKTPKGFVRWFLWLPCDTDLLSDIERQWLQDFARMNGGALPHFNRQQPPWR